MGTACHENNNASLGFSRADKSVPDTTRGVVLYGGDIPISGQPDSRDGSRPYKEKKTLPGTLANVSEFVHVTVLDDTQKSPARRQNRRTKTLECHLSPWAGSGILTRFPFAPRGCQHKHTHTYAQCSTQTESKLGTPRLCTESPDRLGPPDPWPTAVPMEPFSTSAFKVLT